MLPPIQATSVSAVSVFKHRGGALFLPLVATLLSVVKPLKTLPEHLRWLEVQPLG